MWTPWGKADSIYKHARGIIFYGTPSHGGIHVSAKKNLLIPEYMRKDDGWYEEDCDWSIPGVVFPEAFSEKDRIGAKDTLRSWHPDAYEKFFGEVVYPGQSYIRDRDIFNKTHENDWVVIAASGSWHEKARPGFCYCIATRGGKRDVERGYLVPQSEYDKRSHYGFVIDETRHERIL